MRNTVVLAHSLNRFTVKGEDNFFRLICIPANETEDVKKEFGVKCAQELLGKSVMLDVIKHRVYCADATKSDGVACHYGYV